MYFSDRLIRSPQTNSYTRAPVTNTILHIGEHAIHTLAQCVMWL